MTIDEEIQSKFPNPQVRVTVNLRYTSNYLGAIQAEFMSEFSLSMAQFNILRILRGAKESLAINTVKERMIEKSPNTTRLMDKLIDKGFISRERCSDDRRVVYVKITKEGLALLKQIDDRFVENKNMFTPNLSDKEATLLSELLDKLRDGVRG